METHKVQLRQPHIRILPMYAVTMTHRRWLRPVKFAVEAFEGTVASEVGTPGFSHIAIGRSRVE
jgi:hypothetical protein